MLTSTPPIGTANVSTTTPTRRLRPGKGGVALTTTAGSRAGSCAGSTAAPNSAQPLAPNASRLSNAPRDGTALEFRQTGVRFGPAVAVELPHVPHLANLVEVQFGRHELGLVARRTGDELAARVAEVALAVEFADVPRRLIPDAVDGADEEGVGDGVGGLLELPEILRQPGDGGRRIEHNFRSVQTQLPGPFREVTVITDVHAYISILCFTNWIAEVAGLEVEFLPEAGRRMRDMVLAVLAEVGAVGVDDGGGVVVDAGRLLFVQRHDDDHAVLLGQLLHELRRRSVGNLLRRFVPPRRLLGAEVRSGEDLLHAEELDAFLPGLLDQLDVLRDVGLADRVELLVGGAGVRGLNQSGFDDARHGQCLSVISR